MTLKDWTPRETPGGIVLEGARVRLEPLDWAVHGDALFSAIAGPGNESIWRYMPDGPYDTREMFEQRFGHLVETRGWKPLIILRAGNGETLGMAAYMRLREAHGSVEVGAVAFSEALKRTPEATEAMALMAAHVFDDLGYRRYEWKCHNQNEASRRAALRFGFVYEGVFRNDMVIRGASRDTAWFAMTDDDWPLRRAAFTAWLSPDNFGEDGRQSQRLEDIRRALDPASPID